MSTTPTETDAAMLALLRASIQRMRDRGVLGQLAVHIAPMHAVQVRHLNTAHKLALRVVVSADTPEDEARMQGLKPKAQPMARPAARRPNSTPAPYYRQFDGRGRRRGR